MFDSVPLPARAPALLLLLPCVAALSGCTRTHESGAESNPVAAARDFVTDAVIDHNGYQACSYLTTRQQRIAARRAGGECRWAFDKAHLTLGRHHIDSVQQVRHLSATLAKRGRRARVRLSRGGAGVEFRLVKRSPAEREEFSPPDTVWRIAHGGLAVVAQTSPEEVSR